MNFIKTLPPLKVNIFKYHEVKAFCDPQRRKYSLWERVEAKLVLSVSEEELLSERQSLDKPNLREMGQIKEPIPHMQQGASEDHPQVGKQGCQDALKSNLDFWSPRTYTTQWKKKKQRQSRFSI